MGLFSNAWRSSSKTKFSFTRAFRTASYVHLGFTLQREPLVEQLRRGPLGSATLGIVTASELTPNTTVSVPAIRASMGFPPFLEGVDISYKSNSSSKVHVPFRAASRRSANAKSLRRMRK